jgi:hypothetical protein
LACPQCRKDIFHKHLDKEYIQPVMELKKRVESMAVGQMKIEFPMMNPEEKAKADAEGHAEYAEAHFSFELCHKCQLPYFAGRVDCAAGVDEAGPGAQAADAVCSTCRDLTGLDKPCEKHGKEAMVWKCRYGCHLATYECFNYLHVCAPCHGNEILCKYMDFNVHVEGGHARRGGVPGEDRVYANKMDVWEYPQCPGPELCPLGAGTIHPPTGIEYCFGCSLCKDELSTLKQTLEPLRPLFLKLASALHAGHEDGFDPEANNNDELEARLRHVIWLCGATVVRGSEISKREAIHVMQYMLQGSGFPLDKYTIKLKGSVDALRRRVRPEGLATVVTSWRAEPSVYAEIEKTSCLTTSFTRSLKNPTQPTVNVAVRYNVAGGALPEGAMAATATTLDLIKTLVDAHGLSADQVSKITLLHDGEPLNPEEKVLPLFTGPTLCLGTKTASAVSLSDCLIV